MGRLCRKPGSAACVLMRSSWVVSSDAFARVENALEEEGALCGRIACAAQNVILYTERQKCDNCYAALTTGIQLLLHAQTAPLYRTHPRTCPLHQVPDRTNAPHQGPPPAGLLSSHFECHLPHPYYGHLVLRSRVYRDCAIPGWVRLYRLYRAVGQLVATLCRRQ